MPEKNIEAIWAEIESWLQDNMPDALPLPPGIPSKALKKAEETLGFELPAQLQQFLLIHDGSADLWLHDRGVFNSLQGLLESWDQEVDLWGDGENDEEAEPEDPAIKKNWFNRNWLPILDAWTGDYVCIDLSPTERGVVGQIISWSHTDGPIEVLAPSFEVLLRDFVSELEAGKYTPKVNQQGGLYLEYAAT